MFPLSLGAEGSCQIGGNVATNAGGVNVLRYGMMRDLVLGLEAVLPDGSIWEGLSGLRKDNRGFDLKQLFIGSEGILGIITAASLKLFPKPETVETAYIGVSSFADAIELFRQARRTSADLLSAFEVIGSECLPMAARIYPDMRNPLSTEAPVHILLEVSGTQTVELRSAVEQLLAEGIESGLVKDAVLAAASVSRSPFGRSVKASWRGKRNAAITFAAMSPWLFRKSRRSSTICARCSGPNSPVGPGKPMATSEMATCISMPCPHPR